MRQRHSLMCAAALAASSVAQADGYRQPQLNSESSIRTAVVESVRPVVVRGHSAAGTFAGGALGAIAGSKLGAGRGSLAGAVVGAVAGGLAGAVAEEALTRTGAIEITCTLQDGSLVAIAQEGGEEDFAAGDQVRLVSSGGETHVVKQQKRDKQ